MQPSTGNVDVSNLVDNSQVVQSPLFKKTEQINIGNICLSKQQSWYSTKAWVDKIIPKDANLQTSILLV